MCIYVCTCAVIKIYNNRVDAANAFNSPALPTTTTTPRSRMLSERCIISNQNDDGIERMLHARARSRCAQVKWDYV